MPYIQDIEEENEDKAVPVLGSSDGAPITSSSSQKTPDNSGTSSGRFTNIQNYLNANKQQSGTLASGITDKIDSSITESKSAIENKSSDFSNQVNANKIDLNTDVINQVKANPVNVNVDDFTKMRDASYSGPTELDVSNEEYSLNDNLDRIDLTKSEAGRNALLVDTYQRPNYSTGQQNLDQLLLQNNDSSKGVFNDLQSRWSGINDWLSGVKTDAVNQVTNAVNTTNATKQAANEAVNQELSDFQTNLNTKLENVKTDQQNLYNSYSEDIQDNIVNQQTLEALGLNNGDRLYDLNLSDYLNTFNPGQADLHTVASDEEFAQYNALAKLAGIEPTMLFDQQRVNTYNPSYFNVDALLSDRASAEQAYNANAQVQADLMNSGIEAWNNIRGSKVPISGSVTDLESAKAIRDYIQSVDPTIWDVVANEQNAPESYNWSSNTLELQRASEHYSWLKNLKDYIDSQESVNTLQLNNVKNPESGGSDSSGIYVPVGK